MVVLGRRSRRTVVPAADAAAVDDRLPGEQVRFADGAEPLDALLRLGLGPPGVELLYEAPGRAAGGRGGGG